MLNGAELHAKRIQGRNTRRINIAKSAQEGKVSCLDCECMGVNGFEGMTRRFDVDEPRQLSSRR